MPIDEQQPPADRVPAVADGGGADFQEDAGPEERGRAEGFSLALEGYEGPIDLLLELARDQKVDLARLSILALAEQYLSFVQQARSLRLELAADYLVMAAWLAYLKSRLLLPELEDETGEPSGAEMAAALAFQLQRLESMRQAGQRLLERPRLGLGRLARGAPEVVSLQSNNVYEVSLYDLLKAYGGCRQRGRASRLDIPIVQLHTVEEAIARLERMIGRLPGWQPLVSFLPDELAGGLKWRSAVASTFAASLELVRQGKAQLRQDGTFGPLYLQRESDAS
ncbi:MAG: ScpA family protein [Rhodospirillales bacterium]